MTCRLNVTFGLFVAALIVSIAVPSVVAAQETPRPRVEVAFVLDTTGSMAGLIEGAKAKIWDTANLIISAEPTPDIRFGLIGYRDRGDAYITEFHDLTDDIDAIYGHLRGFGADGGGDGPESVNQALNEAVTRMSWSDGDGVLRIIFLVGDAPPHMDYADDVRYHLSVEQATERGIVVNTIQCGEWAETAQIWQEIAQLGNGEYASIGQSGDVVVIATPFDEQLAELNRELGTTIVPYGVRAEREAIAGYQDAAEEAAPAEAADRLRFRAASGRVGGASGDLLDAITAGEIDLESVDEEQLPENLRSMSVEERQAFVAVKQQRRGELQTQINDLLSQRQAFIDAERAAMREAGGLTGFDAEVDRMIREQASEIGISFE